MSPFLNANTLNLFNSVCNNNNNNLLPLEVSPSRDSSTNSPSATTATTTSLSNNVSASSSSLPSTTLASTSTIDLNNVTTTLSTTSISPKLTMAQSLYSNANFSELFGANFASMFNTNPSAAAAAMSFMAQNQNSLSSASTTNSPSTNTALSTNASNLSATALSSIALNTNTTTVSTTAPVSPKTAMTQSLYSNANFNELFGSNFASMFNTNPTAAAAALAFMATNQSQADSLLKSYSSTSSIANLNSANTTASNVTSTINFSRSLDLESNQVIDSENIKKSSQSSQSDDNTKDIKLTIKQEVTPTKNSINSE